MLSEISNRVERRTTKYCRSWLLNTTLKDLSTKYHMDNRDNNTGEIDEHRELLEEIAELDLPVAEHAQRILANLDTDEE